jgi:cation diffusion facilitator family transporter
MSGHHDHGGDGTGKTVILNLAVNVGLTIAKWLAFLLTGSPSLFGEAAHSTADSLNPILLWTGFRRGHRPKDERHPFGHGRETFFWSLISAQMMLLIGSCLTAWHGIETIITRRGPEFSAWSLGIMAAALLAESVTLTMAYRRLQRERGAGLMEKISGSNNTVLLGILMENGVDAMAVVLAFAGYGLFVLTGNVLCDAVCSLLIALVLAASSLFLINRNRSLLIGEKARPEIAEAIAAAASRPSVKEVVGVTAVMRGPDHVHCRLRLKLNDEWFVDGWCCGPSAKPYLAGDPIRWCLKHLETEIADIKHDIRRRVPEVSSLEIEFN